MTSPHSFDEDSNQVDVDKDVDRDVDDTISSRTIDGQTRNRPFLALVGSSTSTVVAGTFFLVLSYRRDAYMLTFFIGSILNAIASKLLKRLLDQDRPAVAVTGMNRGGGDAEGEG